MKKKPTMPSERNSMPGHTTSSSPDPTHSSKRRRVGGSHVASLRSEGGPVLPVSAMGPKAEAAAAAARAAADPASRGGAPARQIPAMGAGVLFCCGVAGVASLAVVAVQVRPPLIDAEVENWYEGASAKTPWLSKSYLLRNVVRITQINPYRELPRSVQPLCASPFLAPPFSLTDLALEPVLVETQLKQRAIAEHLKLGQRQQAKDFIEVLEKIGEDSPEDLQQMRDLVDASYRQ